MPWCCTLYFISEVFNLINKKLWLLCGQMARLSSWGRVPGLICSVSLNTSANLWFLYYQRVENEKIISQIVGVSQVCDQNGDRVPKTDKNCHINTRLEGTFKFNMKIWDSIIRKKLYNIKLSTVDENKYLACRGLRPVGRRSRWSGRERDLRDAVEWWKSPCQFLFKKKIVKLVNQKVNIYFEVFCYKFNSIQGIRIQWGLKYLWSKTVRLENGGDFEQPWHACSHARD